MTFEYAAVPKDTIIVNDKFICRLLFADTREVSVSERMREANLIIIIVNVKFILTFTIIIPYIYVIVNRTPLKSV